MKLNPGEKFPAEFPVVKAAFVNQRQVGKKFSDGPGKDTIIFSQNVSGFQVAEDFSCLNPAAGRFGFQEKSIHLWQAFDFTPQNRP
jgi:hypothetical protein